MLSDSELGRCLTLLEIVEPPTAKQFWQAAEAKPGIYIILAGKCRLLDSADNLITTLSVGESFGEVTLFPEQELTNYAARASVNLKLGYIPKEALQEVIRQYPSIGDRMSARAEIWDFLVSFQNRHQGMPKALSLFERHQLEIGSVDASLSEDSKLWLLYKGQLKHKENCITPGNFLVPEAEKQRQWMATEPSILYILKNSDVSTALQHCPQLAELLGDSQVLIQTSAKKSKQERITSPRNVIPFPQRDAQTTKGDRTAKPNSKKPHPKFPTPKLAARHLWGRLSNSYPFFAQQSAADCGAACLVMIGRHWGKRFSVNKVRDLSNANRSGASMRALASAAETLGFTSRPVKASLDKLAQQPLPAIAHWEGKHYIVVYEITKKQVIVGDPAIGQRHLSTAEFQAGWTGYALLLQPTAVLKETEEANSGLWQYFDLVKPHWQVLLEVFIASVLIQLFGLVTPLFTQLLLDRVIVQGSTLTLNTVGLGLLIFGLFRIIINGARQYWLDHTANRVGVALLVGFLQHTFRLPLAFFESRYVGDILSRVQ
ncbi:MAG: cyclic nucleotide-binding domain-containing protein, partial [Tolypothrix sp. T3-bin4]|nr:cyclic nucleotide-binding domain-containing protein [Tolypothrix sp. T3-bin4]